ncbi:NepR family anti-sigma factor [Maritalea mediterranea]|uniref:NepR family anti-sigma factor n=1 Tax=Maritalea mediterranea TaxID=2909667 RepID=UPI003F709ABB
MNQHAGKNGTKNVDGDDVDESETALVADGSEMISEKLKQLYDSVAEEGISDRFLDLLEKLDAAEQKSSDEERSS